MTIPGNDSSLSPIRVDETVIEMSLSPIEKGETSAQKVQRELMESEELARRLMAEEAIESYRQSVSFLQENANDYSQEDFVMIQAAMGHFTDSAEQDDEENVDDDGELVSSSEMSYETLLRLGEEIGDVKSERWVLRAKVEINKLPVVQFDPFEISDDKCLVCQIPYEPNDKLRKLPCSHYFHQDCVDQWLMTKDICPYCRQSIIH